VQDIELVRNARQNNNLISKSKLQCTKCSVGNVGRDGNVGRWGMWEEDFKNYEDVNIIIYFGLL